MTFSLQTNENCGLCRPFSSTKSWGQRGHLEILRMLLAARADPDQASCDGGRPQLSQQSVMFLWRGHCEALALPADSSRVPIFSRVFGCQTSFLGVEDWLYGITPSNVYAWRGSVRKISGWASPQAAVTWRWFDCCWMQVRNWSIRALIAVDIHCCWRHSEEIWKSWECW